jgi:hypothetical protein
MSQRTKVTGLSTLALLTAGLLCVSFFLYKSAFTLSFILILITGIQSMVVFWGLGWALPRSGHAFYSIFVGDALLRLVGIGFAVYWLWAHALPYTAPLLLLACAYLLFSVVQIPFFVRVR